MRVTGPSVSMAKVAASELKCARIVAHLKSEGSRQRSTDGCRWHLAVYVRPCCYSLQIVVRVDTL